MEQNSSKTWLWVVAVVAAVAAAAWLWSQQAVAPETSAGPTLSADDTTVAIEQELNATDFGDLEAELQSTEADLQSL